MTTVHTIETLDGAARQPFEHLTFRHVREAFYNDSPGMQTYVIGSRTNGQPSGLVVLDRRQGEQAARVLSFFVGTQFRQRGVATSLMAAMNDLAQQMGISQFSLEYVVGRNTPILEHVLAQNGWGQPAVILFIYKTDLAHIAHAKWIKPMRLPAEFTFIPIRQLSKAQVLEIINHEARGYPAYLNPFKDAARIHPDLTWFLLHQDQVVGWSIVHAIAPDTVLYNSLYVDHDYQQLGMPFMLVAESIRQQAKMGIQNGMFSVLIGNQRMRKIIDSKLLPYITQQQEMRKCVKDHAV